MIKMVKSRHELPVIMAILLILISLTGCGSGSGSGNGTSTNNGGFGISADKAFNSTDAWGINGITEDIIEEQPMEPEEADFKGTDSEVEPVTTNPQSQVKTEKLVYRADVNIEVKNFDESINLLREKIKSLDGIIQYERYYDDETYDYYSSPAQKNKTSGYKHFSTVVRVPTEKFNGFVEDLNTVGHILSSSSQVENITQRYYNTEIDLDSYRNQLQVLQDMYKKADTIPDMLQIEARISEVKSEISKLTTVIQTMDTDVSYSTVEISVNEVTEYEDTSKEYRDKTFIEKLGLRFVDSWNGLLYFLEHFTYFIIDTIWLILFIVVLVFVIRYVRRNKRVVRGNGKGKKLRNNKLGTPENTEYGDDKDSVNPRR